VLLCLSAAIVYALRFGDTVQRFATIALVSGSLLFYSLDIVENPNSYYDYATESHAQLLAVWLTRYGVVQSMMLLARCRSLCPLPSPNVHTPASRSQGGHS
jgi:hypothetical protein